MLQKLKNKSEGFTIIEVLIVLAIAGLIILIVFLAVPALQRNSRNTQRKNDAAAIASAAATVSNNAAGNLVKQVHSGNGTAPDETSVSIRPSTSVTTQETVRLGLYKAGTTAGWSANTGKIYVSDQTGAGALPAYNVVAVGSEGTTNLSRESVTIVVGANCNSSGTGLDTTKNARSLAVLYVIEGAGNNNGNLQCAS